jgi:hypothetical protein
MPQMALFVLCVRRYCGPAMVRSLLEPPPQSCFSESGRGHRRSTGVPGREMSIDRGRFGTNSQRLAHLRSFRRVA